MLILAGVSLNAIVGENGVLKQAQNAVIANKKAEILEKLNLELTKYNIDSFTDVEIGAKQMLAELKANELIDEILNSSGYSDNADEALPVPRFDEDKKYTGEFIYGVKKEGYGINIYTANDGVYKAEYGEISFSAGGSVEEGTILVTEDSFNTNPTDPEGNALPPTEVGKYSITGNSNIIFIDPIDGQLSFYVQRGANATINIFNDMTLTNNGIDRSAIDIEPGGILNIYIAKDKTLTVDSGVGKKGANANGAAAVGGPGGYAGIHVPKYTVAADYVTGYDTSTGAKKTKHYNIGTATLNLSGEGTIVAYGGNAGAGGDGYGHPFGGGGGGGAGAGIGGNGGAGGNGGGFITYEISGDYRTINNGEDGEKGEDCGEINVNESITVYAYGGAGGGGGIGTNSTGGGGGGYPGAGIGGGGAGGGGGEHEDGAGGYTGGSSNRCGAYRAQNGKVCGVVGNEAGDGGSYLSAGLGYCYTKRGIGQIGGQGSCWGPDNYDAQYLRS